MNRFVTTTYLEMTGRSQLRPAARGKTSGAIVRAEVPRPELNGFLYSAVGARGLHRERRHITGVRLGRARREFPGARGNVTQHPYSDMTGVQDP